MNKFNHKKIFFNRAKVIKSNRIHCDNCFEQVVFLLRDKDHEFSLGMKSILECLAFAVKNGDLPKLPASWLSDVENAFDIYFDEEISYYDYETFENSQQIFEAVATRCKTGKPEYFTKGKCSDIYKAVEASSSMPLLSRMVTLDGKKYLDGGISMPIAYERPMELGYDKIVLVLTREQGYRKHQEGRWMKRAYDRYFAPLPSLRQSLRDIPERYNRIQEELDRLEAEGRIFIIRPDHPVEVSRLEQDVHKIQALYDEGRRIALEQLPALKNYLELPQ